MDRWTDSIPGWTGKGDCVSLVNRFEVLRYELLRHVDDCDSRPDGESDVVHGCQRPRYAAAPFQLSTYMASDCDYRGFPEPQGLGFERGILKEDFQFDKALLFYGVEYKFEFSMLSAFGIGAFFAGFLCKP